MDRTVAGTAAVAAVALLSACSSNPKPAAVVPQSAPPAAPAVNLAARQDSLAKARADSLARAEKLAQAHADSVRAEVMRETVNASKDVTNTGLNSADAAAIAEQVHFDYNKADLTAADLQLLQQKLRILQAHPQLVVQVAGNCDERGSDEYNMALGERRAASAKRWLTAHGIAADRITTTSYGKERPLDTDHTEAAWARNRRDDFVVTRRVG